MKLQSGGRLGVRTWGSASIRVEGEVSGIYQSHLSLANLKHKRGNKDKGD